MQEETEFFEVLGARLAAHREACGYTQAELAAKLGIGQQTLANYETGRSRVSVFTLLAISKLLRFSLDEFVAPNPLAPALAGRLQRQLAALADLPKTKQRFAADLIDTILAQEKREKRR